MDSFSRALSLSLALLLVWAAPAWGQWQSNSDGIHYDGGRVGVGTNSPNYDLDVETSVHNGFSVGKGGDNGRIWTEYANYGPNLIFYDYDDRAVIRFRESPTTNNENDPEYEAIISGDKGNVGIGTLNPSKELTVAGKVLAEEVIVKPQSEWADYVFEESYDLPTLAEVSAFIDEEGHLPSVPTAESVKKNGLRLGEMDATLLRKVEELTLYAIEQKERIEEQNGQIDSLQAVNQRLRRRLREQEATSRQHEKQLRRQQEQIGALMEVIEKGE